MGLRRIVRWLLKQEGGSVALRHRRAARSCRPTRPAWRYVLAISALMGMGGGKALKKHIGIPIHRSLEDILSWSPPNEFRGLYTQTDEPPSALPCGSPVSSWEHHSEGESHSEGEGEGEGEGGGEGE